MAAAAACGSPADVLPVERVASHVTVQPQNRSLHIADTVQLEATVLDQYQVPLETPVQWESRNENVAVVSDSGLVTGAAPGNVYIVASAGQAHDSALLTVVASTVPRDIITITPSQATLAVGDSMVFSAYTLSSSGPVEWSVVSGGGVTLGAPVETVSGSALTSRVTVRGVTAGTATIEARSQTGKYVVADLTVGGS